MSKFWIYLKTSMRTDLRQGHIVAGMFILLPLFFTVVMSFSYSSAFVPETSMEAIQISVDNEDNGEIGGMLVETLSSQSTSEYIAITDEEDSDFHVTIQPDYSEKMEETLITIETKENSSSSEEAMLKQFVMDWQQAAVEQEMLMTELAALEDTEAANTLVESLEDVDEMSLDSTFTTETYESETALTSTQFSSVTGIIYILVMSLSGGAGMSTNKALQGLRKRISMVPLSPKLTILYEIGTNTILYTIISFVFMMIWRLIDNQTFSGNGLVYLLWIIIYTLFFQVISSALLYLIPDKLANMIYQGFLMIYMVFGFIPVDRMIGGAIGEFFSQNLVRQLFNQPLYDYMLSGRSFGNVPIMIGLLLASALITILTIQFKERRELHPA